MARHYCTTWPNDVANHATSTNVHEKFDHFQTCPNTSQHVASGWPNARNMLRPTVLQYAALKSCDRLAANSAIGDFRIPLCLCVASVRKIAP